MPVVTPLQVQEAFKRLQLPFSFSPEELTSFKTTTVIENDARILSFPTPTANLGLNILNLRRLVGVDPGRPPSFFDHPWYLEEAFGYSDCEPGWHQVQMDVWPDSIEKPFDYHHSLESRGWALPTAVEVVLMLFLHFVRTGERLLLKKHTWCRDQATLGRMVTVGAFGRNGVFISGHPPSFASRGLGICGTLIQSRIGGAP